MVILRDARAEFFTDIIGKELLRNRSTLYTLLVVRDKLDLKDAYDKNKESSASEDEDSESDDRQDRKLRADAIEKRIEKRKWSRKRQEILMDYESFSFNATSSSVVLFDLAWKLSQDNNCLLWFSIVGQTSQLVTHAINREHYIDQLEYLQSHVSRLSHVSQFSSGPTNTDESKAKIEISFEDELLLWLYRHWSLKESLEVSMITASKFKLFTECGQKRMQEFLVQLGLPRRECAQRFSTMSGVIRDNLNSLFLQHGEKFGLSRRELFLPSFIVQLGYKTPISALDAVFLAISSLDSQGDGDPIENFQSTLDTLSCWAMPSLDAELLRAQSHLQSLSKQVRNSLDTDDVVAFGPFLYVYIRKIDPIWDIPPLLLSVVIVLIFFECLQGIELHREDMLKLFEALASLLS